MVESRKRSIRTTPWFTDLFGVFSLMESKIELDKVLIPRGRGDAIVKITSE